jgi:hypothetical protein
VSGDKCEHEFQCSVDIHVFQDKAPLAQVELRGHCEKCGAALEFIGIECGVNLNGPAVSPDKREARLAAIITNEPAALKHSRGPVRYDLPGIKNDD